MYCVGKGMTQNKNNRTGNLRTLKYEIVEDRDTSKPKKNTK
jgi:hypothetical protein